jgi:hypothetical protein
MQGIPGAPLWDSSSQQFVGMLTASDFISILQRVRFYFHGCRFLPIRADFLLFSIGIDGILLMLNFTFLMDVFFELFASCLSMNATNESSHA